MSFSPEPAEAIWLQKHIFALVKGRSSLFPWDARGLPWARMKRHLVGGPFKFPLTEARACHMDVI